MSKVHTVVDSAVGPLTLVADSSGALCGLYMDRQRHLPDAEAFGRADAGPFDGVVAQLREYFAGRLRRFDVPLAPEGTQFQRRVWDALTRIPYGETTSYGQLAEEIDAPKASRAVGAANGRNPISIVVPCHRVVGADGSLTGYGGGVERKRLLLDLERSHAGATLV
ncbi:MAG: methylated-DNA--[protein]-cysteine S-methyltransferase [Stackebrandtia sp.]